MKGFDLHEPTTVSQAVGLLNQLGTGGKVVAGGSDTVGGIMKGQDIKATARTAAGQIRTVARPMSLNAYKVDIAQNLIERTLLQALG